MTVSIVGCNATKTIDETSSNISSYLNTTGVYTDDDICEQLSSLITQGGNPVNEVFINEVDGEAILQVMVYHKELNKGDKFYHVTNWSSEKKKAFAKAIEWDALIKSTTGVAKAIQEYAEGYGIPKSRLMIRGDKDIVDYIFLGYEDGRLVYDILE